MTERERLRNAIDLTTDNWTETHSSIIVTGVRKYTFHPTGMLRGVWNWSPAGWKRVAMKEIEK
jgi:hypothetical protein